MVHCRSAKEACRSLAMLGNATFTIVMSSSSISMPRHTVVNVHHLRVICGSPKGLGTTRASRRAAPLAPAGSPGCGSPRAEELVQPRALDGRGVEAVREALAPARVEQPPAELALGLRVRRPAALGHPPDADL